VPCQAFGQRENGGQPEPPGSSPSRSWDSPRKERGTRAHRAAYLHRTPSAPSGDAPRGREPSRKDTPAQSAHLPWRAVPGGTGPGRCGPPHPSGVHATPSGCASRGETASRQDTPAQYRRCWVGRVWRAVPGGSGPGRCAVRRTLALPKDIGTMWRAAPAQCQGVQVSRIPSGDAPRRTLGRCTRSSKPLGATAANRGEGRARKWTCTRRMVVDGLGQTGLH
jgi:hypothetical protein